MSEVREILKGIDETEIESDDGWWETSTGAEFGVSKLAEVESLVARKDAAIQGAHDELMNLQPHISQSCRPGHEPFIDSHVDKAMELLSAVSGSPKRECFWPTGYANSERCSKAGQCIARWQNANKDKLFGRDSADNRPTPADYDKPRCGDCGTLIDNCLDICPECGGGEKACDDSSQLPINEQRDAACLDAGCPMEGEHLPHCDISLRAATDNGGATDE